METRTMYMTFTRINLIYPWTRPRACAWKSTYSGINQIAAKLLEMKKIVAPSGKKFGIWVRREYPEIVVEAREYLGETREVEVPLDTSPREYREQFCTVQCNPEAINRTDESLAGGMA